MTLWIFSGAIELGPAAFSDVLWLIGTALIASCLLHRGGTEYMVWKGLLGWCYVVSAYLVRHSILRSLIVGTVEGDESLHWLRMVSLTHSASRTFVIPVIVSLSLLGWILIRWTREDGRSVKRLVFNGVLLVIVSAVFLLVTCYLWQEGVKVEGGVLQQPRGM